MSSGYLLAIALLAANPVAAPPSALLSEAVTKEFDADHDGILSGPEREAAQAAMLKRYDANGNGRLDPAEMLTVVRPLAATKAAEQAMQPPTAATPQHNAADAIEATLTPEALDRFDIDHDGRLSAAERKAASSDHGLKRMVAQTLLRFDTDGDGKLNAAERRAAQTALARSRVGVQQKRKRQITAENSEDADAKGK